MISTVLWRKVKSLPSHDNNDDKWNLADQIWPFSDFWLSFEEKLYLLSFSVAESVRLVSMQTFKRRHFKAKSELKNLEGHI